MAVKRKRRTLNAFKTRKAEPFMTAEEFSRMLEMEETNLVNYECFASQRCLNMPVIITKIRI
jgi:hypothetical protein